MLLLVFSYVLIRYIFARFFGICLHSLDERDMTNIIGLLAYMLNCLNMW